MARTLVRATRVVVYSARVSSLSLLRMRAGVSCFRRSIERIRSLQQAVLLLLLLQVSWGLNFLGIRERGRGGPFLERVRSSRERMARGRFAYIHTASEDGCCCCFFVGAGFELWDLVGSWDRKFMIGWRENVYLTNRGKYKVFDKKFLIIDNRKWTFIFLKESMHLWDCEANAVSKLHGIRWY